MGLVSILRERCLERYCISSGATPSCDLKHNTVSTFECECNIHRWFSTRPYRYLLLEFEITIAPAVFAIFAPNLINNQSRRQFRSGPWKPGQARAGACRDCGARHQDAASRDPCSGRTSTLSLTIPRLFLRTAKRGCPRIHFDGAMKY